MTTRRRQSCRHKHRYPTRQAFSRRCGTRLRRSPERGTISRRHARLRMKRVLGHRSLEVSDCTTKTSWIISYHAQRAIAGRAQQSPNAASNVAVIHVQVSVTARFNAAADGTNTVLFGQKRVILFNGDTEPAMQRCAPIRLPDLIRVLDLPFLPLLHFARAAASTRVAVLPYAEILARLRLFTARALLRWRLPTREQRLPDLLLLPIGHSHTSSRHAHKTTRDLGQCRTSRHVGHRLNYGRRS